MKIAQIAPLMESCPPKFYRAPNGSCRGLGDHRHFFEREHPLDEKRKGPPPGERRPRPEGRPDCPGPDPVKLLNAAAAVSIIFWPKACDRRASRCGRPQTRVDAEQAKPRGVREGLARSDRPTMSWGALSSAPGQKSPKLGARSPQLQWPARTIEALPQVRHERQR